MEERMFELKCLCVCGRWKGVRVIGEWQAWCGNARYSATLV